MGSAGFDCSLDWLSGRDLAKWVRQAEPGKGVRNGLIVSGSERLKALERENRVLKRANEILRSSSAYFAQAALDRRAK